MKRVLFAVGVVGLAVAIFFVFFDAEKNDTPEGTVANVAGRSIPVSRYAVVTREIEAFGKPHVKSAVVPDPPNFNRCAKWLRKHSEFDAPDSTLKETCRAQFESINEDVMQSLIMAEWYELEADRLDLTVTAAEMEAGLKRLKSSSFSSSSEFERFQKVTGMSDADVSGFVRADVLRLKLESNSIAPAKKQIGDAEAAKAYRRAKEELVVPETRDVRVGFTKNKATAERALSELQEGAPWDEVSSTYFRHTFKGNEGTLFEKASKLSFSPELSKRIFAAKVGVPSGPVKVGKGFDVFEVVRINSSRQQSFEESKASLRTNLTKRIERQLLDQHRKDLQNRWKPRTVCAAAYMAKICGSSTD